MRDFEFVHSRYQAFQSDSSSLDNIRAQYGMDLEDLKECKLLKCLVIIILCFSYGVLFNELEAKVGLFSEITKLSSGGWTCSLKSGLSMIALTSPPIPSPSGLHKNTRSGLTKGIMCLSLSH